VVQARLLPLHSLPPAGIGNAPQVHHVLKLMALLPLLNGCYCCFLLLGLQAEPD
jgi:hypothetical protein